MDAAGLRPLLNATAPVVDGVDVRRETLPRHGAASLLIYEPRTRTPDGGALLWIHGGGHMVGNAEADNTVCSEFARDLGVPVISVEYRLAPYPTDLDDCMAALRWVHDHAAELDIDPDRIAVGGASAGGGLAAAVAQRAHDKQVGVCFQLLQYPMLDDRVGTEPDRNGRGKLVWTPALNQMAWTWYLGHETGAPEPRPYAISGRRPILTGLAPAWVGVGELDLFHDENLTYAHRLREAGVECTLEVVGGMYHGADRGSDAPAMVRFRNSMTEALRPHVA